MFRKDGIQWFLDDVDPKIFARGLVYYESGNAERIDHDGGHVAAEVFDRDVGPYRVDGGNLELKAHQIAALKSLEKIRDPKKQN